MNEHFCRLVGEWLISEEIKEARATLAQRLIAAIGGLCLLILLALAATWPTGAHAAEVFRDKDDRGGPAVLKLSDKPCTDAKVKAHLFAQLLDDRRFKAATLHYWGRDWASCWAEVTNQRGQKIVVSIDEQGSPFQPVPRAAFKDETI